MGDVFHHLPNSFVQLQELGKKVTHRTGHLLCRTACEHTYRQTSVSGLPRRTLFQSSFKHLLKMPRRSRRFSFTESDSWARTSFSSSPSWVLASWRLFFSCLTLVSTFSPAFNRHMSCCLSGSIPAPSAILLSDFYTRRTSQVIYLLKRILPEGVSLPSPDAASVASSWALHSSSSWDSWVFFSVRSCIINDP